MVIIEVEVQVHPGIPRQKEASAGGSDAPLVGGGSDDSARIRGVSQGEEASAGGGGGSDDSAARISSCNLAPARSARDADPVQSGLKCSGSPPLPRFSLPQERFRSLFPFHILLDASGTLVQVSMVRWLGQFVFWLAVVLLLLLLLLCAQIPIYRCPRSETVCSRSSKMFLTSRHAAFPSFSR